MISIFIFNFILRLYIVTLSSGSDISHIFSYIQTSERHLDLHYEELSCQEFKNMEEVRDYHAEEIICP